MEPTILVGIPNTHARYREYTPGKTYDDILEHPYANYVVDVVKRYVDRKISDEERSPSHGVDGFVARRAGLVVDGAQTSRDVQQGGVSFRRVSGPRSTEEIVCGFCARTRPSGPPYLS